MLELILLLGLLHDPVKLTDLVLSNPLNLSFVLFFNLWSSQLFSFELSFFVDDLLLQVLDLLDGKFSLLSNVFKFSFSLFNNDSGFLLVLFQLDLLLLVVLFLF
jgi:hypothetical protein